MEYIQATVFASIALGFAYLLSRSLNFTITRNSEVEYDPAKDIANGNVALGFRRCGAQIAVALAVLGVFTGKADPNFLVDVASSLGWGLLAIVLVLVSKFIVDKAVLPSINNDDEVKAGNIAVGIVEFGALVMTGIIAFASIYGDGGGWWSSLKSTVGYFVLAQATVVVLVLAYEKLFSKHRLLENIAKGDCASAVYLASKMIAYGFIMVSVVKGDDTAALIPSLIEFGIYTAAGMAYLYVSEWLIDWFIITETTVSEMLAENNVAAALQLAGPTVGVACILGFTVLTLL